MNVENWITRLHSKGLSSTLDAYHIDWDRPHIDWVSKIARTLKISDREDKTEVELSAVVKVLRDGENADSEEKTAKLIAEKNGMSVGFIRWVGDYKIRALLMTSRRMRETDVTALLEAAEDIRKARELLSQGLRTESS